MTFEAIQYFAQLSVFHVNHIIHALPATARGWLFGGSKAYTTRQVIYLRFNVTVSVLCCLFVVTNSANLNYDIKLFGFGL